MRRHNIGMAIGAALASIVFGGCAGMTPEEFNAAAAANAAATGSNERQAKRSRRSSAPETKKAETPRTRKSEPRATETNLDPDPEPVTKPKPAGKLSLAWDASPDAGVAGYRIRYGSKPGSYTGTFDAGGRAEATITGLEPGATYYFVVVAYNRAGVESPPSNEMEAVAK